MNAAQIIAKALRETNTNSADYTSSGEDINTVYQEVCDKITSVSKGDYFWDIGITDTVVNQSEYEADRLGISPDDLSIKKINKVFVKYDSTAVYHTPVKYVSPNTLEYHPDYYKANQLKSNPFFYIQDESIFIYPAPTEVIVGGIEIYVEHTPPVIDETSTENEIEVKPRYHRVIAEGLKVYIYYTQGKLNEAQAQQAIYDRECEEMTSEIKQRYNQPIPYQFTNLDINR